MLFTKYVSAGVVSDTQSPLALTRALSLTCSSPWRLVDCYVADELIVSRAGRRVRVGNTDAEGRMVMVDLLCEMKEKVRTSTLPSTNLTRAFIRLLNNFPV